MTSKWAVAYLIMFGLMFGDAGHGLVLVIASLIGRRLYRQENKVRDVLALPDASIAQYAFDSLIWVNLGWGVLNLLPMLPLDGGNIVASLMELLSPARGRLLACYVSFATIGVLLSDALYFR